MGRVSENLDQSIYMGLTWQLFDGGRAAAQARDQKQKAKESQYLFAEERNDIRLEVETSFFDLQLHARNLISNSRRRTGLDAVARCIFPDLPASPPPKDPSTDVPVFSTPITEPCAFQRATFVPPAD